MPRRRWLPAILAALLTFSLAPGAVAEPDALRAPDGSFLGREPAERGPASFQGLGRFRDAAPAVRLPGQPRNDVIEDVDINPNDASIPLNLIPYHEFPERLRALQMSDRISVEIIGQSVLGRDLHLVVATSPMTDTEWADWQYLSDLRTEDPHEAIAALEAGAYDDWKSPLLINNNIHGNEWEGTDASFQILEELATSEDPDTVRLLDEHVLAFVITQNPDGRVNATRANANGFDMNRDWITQSQPENLAVRDQMIRYNPLTFLDQHGYVNLTLIEPTTGPHGENYEYDLYIRNALRNALAMEEAVLATGEPNRNSGTTGPLTHFERIRIPWRNNTTGWDDWPPIFTPMYAMYHGSVGHTVEFPHNPRSSALSEAARHERTRVNTVIARATIESNFHWVNDNKLDVLADQLELYRRGVDGESSRPIDDELALSLAAGDNAETFLVDFPRAYVIPVGDGQRSDRAAARLTRFLLDNDVRVHQARTPITVEGQRYAAGSYVVDMHQAKRGLANTILDVGRDVTENFPTMYDISAWSLGELWGATVNVMQEGELNTRPLIEVTEVSRTGSVAPGRRAAYGFDVDSLEGVQAVNHLLREGVELTRTDTGTFVLDGTASSVVRQLAEDLGVEFVHLHPTDVADAEPFTTYRIATSAPADEVFALNRMGFEVTPVTHTGFNNGSYAFDDFDGLYVGSAAFNPVQLDETQQGNFGSWLEGGANIVLRTGNGVTFNNRADLLDVTVGPLRNDANGIVAVVNEPTSPIVVGAPDRSFVNAPRHFPTVGDDVRVDQRLAGEGFFLAGHWIDQQVAAGQPVVVSGVARGANVTLFGTEPLYRNHPAGLYTQVASALWWSGS
jgi:hypothetical protein